MHDAAIDEMARLEDTHWWFVGKRLLVQSVLPEPSDGRALDVGCGTGAILDLLGREQSAVGTDASAAALAHCRRRGLRTLVHATVERLPFRPGSFSLVSALDVIEHADDDRAVLREMRAVLRDDGVLVLSVPALQALWSEHDTVLGHRRRYVARTLRAAVEEAGFTVVRMTYTNAFILPAAALWRLLGRRTFSAREGTDFFTLPDLFNRLMIVPYRIEAWLVRRLRLPLGLSLLCVARPSSSPRRVSSSARVRATSA